MARAVRILATREMGCYFGNLLDAFMGCEKIVVILTTVGV
jgi:hypothetical protein